jgi:hypothetical protein
MWLNYKDDRQCGNITKLEKKKERKKKKNLVQPVTTYWEIFWNFSLKL